MDSHRHRWFGIMEMENMTAEILTIGNEVISGHIQDTNARTLASRLNDIGIWVTRFTSVGDHHATLLEEVDRALGRSDILITTGGLGSTHDDITKQALAEYFGMALVTDEKVRSMIEGFYRLRKKPVDRRVLLQCEVPSGATVLYNKKGTAPGLLFERDGKKVFVLPGVPLEMEHLLETWVIPDLAKNNTHRVLHRILNTTGLAESALWEKTGPAEQFEQGVSIASLPSHLGVRIRLTARGTDRDQLVFNLGRAEAGLRKHLDTWIFSVDDETLEERVGNLLRERGRTLALAESCTGGLIASRITRIAGSSDYFLQGMVTYSNAAKISRLGVPAELIDAHGAVSEPVARAMAQGARATTGADIAVSVTGIAGPGGGSEEKPVGLTFICVSDAKGEWVERHVFHQDRARNQDRAAQAALNLLRLRLLGVTPDTLAAEPVRGEAV